MTTSSEDHPTVVVQPSQGVVGVASDTIGALRGSPMLLVMVVLNCAFIVAGAYYLRTQQDNAYRLVDKIFERCLPETRPGQRPYIAPPDDHRGDLKGYLPSPIGEN